MQDEQVLQTTYKDGHWTKINGSTTIVLRTLHLNKL